MENTIVVLGDEDTVLGFRLAGITNAFTVTEENLAEKVEPVKEATLFIVTEEVDEMMRKQNLHGTLRGTVLAIPDKKGSRGVAQERLSQLFESAVGIKLKTKKSE